MFGRNRTHFYYISFVYLKEGQLSFGDLFVGVKGKIDEEMIIDISKEAAEEHDTDHIAILALEEIAAPKGWREP